MPLTVDNSTDLVVAKSVDDATPNEGGTVTYTILLTNNGPAKAENIVVTDVVPDGLTYVVLVGDIADVPTNVGSEESADSDGIYAMVDGADLGLLLANWTG